jgi:predicted DNA-binding transcriptional regulator AlpA
MALISIAEASQLTGKSIPTIYRHIKAGKLSKTNDKLDTAEILRLYGAFPKTTDNKNSQNENQVENIKLSMIQRENELFKQQAERDREQIADLKGDRDHWRNQATLLLTHKPEKLKPEGEQITKPEASLLWRKLFGRH